MMIGGISTLLYSLVMDGTLLWATGQLAGYPVRWSRLMPAAMVGVLPTLWVLWHRNLYATPWEVGLAWPVAMVRLAFGPMRRPVWAKTYLIFLGWTFLAGGFMTALVNWVRWWHPGWELGNGRYLVALFVALGGRWMPKARWRQWLGREEWGFIKCQVGTRRVTIPVLWDSGNQLEEPGTGRKVVVVDSRGLGDALPDHIRQWLQNPTDDHVPPGAIRYRTIAGEGWLPVIPVEQGTGFFAGRWHRLAPFVMGVSAYPVSPSGHYRALASPKLLQRNPNEGVGA